MGEKTPRQLPWTLHLGPGERLASLRPLLAALAPAPDSPSSADVADLGDLLASPTRPQRLVVDVDRLPVEDLGILRRYMERAGSAEVVLLGEDPGQRTARMLLARPGVRWHTWPLDTEALASLVRAPGGAEESEPAQREPLSPVEQEIDEIERILAGQVAAAAPDRDEPARARSDDRPASSRRTRPESDAPFAAEPAVATAPDATIPAPGAAPAAPLPAAEALAAPWRARLPVFYRLQIADLADIAQRLQLSFLALSRSDADSAQRDERLGHLEGEVFRLIQFARTLGYLVAPPTAGGQTLDLGALLREQLAALAGERPPGPSIQIAVHEELWVRADKGLLARALDAVLALARACSSPADVVRVRAGSSENGEDHGRVSVEISFPAGPLGDLRPEEIVQPYALRRRFAALGPNSLAAAEGILRGQGGALALAAPSPGELRWNLELPAERSPGGPTEGEPFA